MRSSILAVYAEGQNVIDAAIDRLQRASSFSALRTAEQDALELLYVHYRDTVWETVYPILVSSADADDVTQSVFLALPHSLQSFRPGNFEGWLRRVAARAALMNLRTRRRSTSREAQMVADENLDPASDAGWHVALMGETESRFAAQSAAVRRAFYALPEPMREVVFLRAIVEMSHSEIAECLGISVGASYTRYCRALTQLRATLGGLHD